MTYDGRKLAIRPLADRTRSSRMVMARLADLRPTRLMEAFTALAANVVPGKLPHDV